MSPADRAKRVMDEVGHVASQYGVKSVDSQYLRDLVARSPRALSVAQEAWLADIEKRVYGEDDDG